MIAIPAVDLRDGCCVQLIGGSYERESIRLDDPVKVAASWKARGFPQLHVVDLDAALGVGSNRDIIRAILQDVDCQIQVGGGIRTTQQIEDLISDGAARVILGTRAIEDRRWLSEVANEFPGVVLVAADVRGRQVVTHGWTVESALDVSLLIEELNACPVAGVLVTAVHLEGRMKGPDLDLAGEAVAASDHPVYASGGIAEMADLRALAARGVHAAVVGMAIYTGALDSSATAKEFRT